MFVVANNMVEERLCVSGLETTAIKMTHLHPRSCRMENASSNAALQEAAPLDCQDRPISHTKNFGGGPVVFDNFYSWF